ncbi:MAG: hypothetical protein ACXVAW_01025 [Vulcanimicrobiaceae bacterium]
MLTWTELEGADRRLRQDLLAFVNEYCHSMTLQQAREWFDEAFPLRQSEDDTRTTFG